MTSFEKVLIGFVAGTAAGAVTALLLAPQDGAKTREDIKKLASEGAEKLSTVAKEKSAELAALAKEKGAQLNKIAQEAMAALEGKEAVTEEPAEEPAEA